MSKQGFHPQPKPSAKTKAPQKRLKPISDKRKAKLPTRAAVRKQCYEDDNGRCRRCYAPVLLKTDDMTKLAHAHEEPSRAQGGDWCNPRDVLILCPRCHELVTRKDVRIQKHPTQGTRGQCVFH